MKRKILTNFLAVTLCLSLALTFTIPVSAMGDLSNTIYAGGCNTFAIKADGSLWEWGVTNASELGNGTTGNEINATPTKVMENVTAVATYTPSSYATAKYTMFGVSVSLGHTVAIKTDGSLWGWGQDQYGQLAGYGKDSKLVPTPVKIMDNVAAASVNHGYTMAIKKDGTLWSWGLNDCGQLGDGTGGTTREGSLQRAIPKKIMDNVAYVSAGDRSAMAIKKDGSLWAWGVPYWVIFNNDTPNFIPTPVKIMDNVASVSAGDAYSMILKKDGSLWGLGWDSYGRMGDGKYDDNDERILSTPFLFYHDKPIKIMDNVASVSVKGTNTMAVKKDGSLWVWGNNYELQLGYDDRGPEGTAEYFTKSRYRNTPYKVMDGVVAASAGMEFSVALKADGSLLTWGNNRVGQLGYEYVNDGDYSNCNPTIALSGVKLPSAPVSDMVAKSTASTVYVNGEAKGFEAYNIDDSNYFKLRDLAYVLNGTGKQFSVSYDNKTMGITLTSGNPYAPVGSEMTKGNGQAKEATPTASKIYLNGNGLNLKVYTIGGNNFFKLRDLMKSLDVYVGYDSATNAITLDTSKGYVEP